MGCTFASVVQYVQIGGSTRSSPRRSYPSGLTALRRSVRVAAATTAGGSPQPWRHAVQNSVVSITPRCVTSTSGARHRGQGCAIETTPRASTRRLPSFVTFGVPGGTRGRRRSVGGWSLMMRQYGETPRTCIWSTCPSSSLKSRISPSCALGGDSSSTTISLRFAAPAWISYFAGPRSRCPDRSCPIPVR